MYEHEKAALDGISGIELVEGFRKGDPNVVAKLYHLYFVKLCDYCYYFLQDSHEAEDVVSRIFEKLLLNDIKISSSLRSLEDVANYLFVAAKTRCINVQKHTKIKRTAQKTLAKAEQAGYTIHDHRDIAYAQAVCDMKLLETVYSLQQRSVQVLRKLYFEDMSYDDIATEMGISKSTVGNLRAQGIHILNNALKREDFVLSIVLVLYFAGVGF